MALAASLLGIAGGDRRHWDCSSAAVHYHVVLTVDGQEDYTGTFDTWREAEAAAKAIGRQRDDWFPRRYPGRPWCPDEVAVYLDRRRGDAGSRSELVVIRCQADEPGAACGKWGRAERS
jgi:hypothetical protein